MSRRAFLSKGGLALAGVGLLAGWIDSGPAGATQAPAKAVKAIDALPWDSLRQSLGKGLLRPGETGYAAAAAPWNSRYADLLPGGIARCRSAEDVQAALLWARSSRLPVAVRGGGRSPGALSSTRGLMIDLSAMNSVDHNAETGLIRVGGGARHGDLFEALRPLGVAITHGRVAELGVCGMALSGGIGFAMRAHGLTCDQLVEVEMVAPSGLVMVCDRQQNPDIFWACRGGGGSFGVCTAMTFRPFPVEEITVFRLGWTSDIDDLLPTLLGLLSESPPSLGCRVETTVNATGHLSLTLTGQVAGPREELDSLLEAAYQIAAPNSEMVETLAYWDGQDRLLEKAPAQMQYVSSRYAYSDFPVQGSDLVLGLLREWPGTGGSATWRVDLCGGAVDQVGRRNTAYAHRGARLLSSLEVSWARGDSDRRVEASLAWAKRLEGALEPLTSRECYGGFAVPSDSSSADASQSLYGENLAYLTVVKRRQDPERALDPPLGIPLEVRG